MRLLLTSDGFPKTSQNIRKKFFEMVRKDAENITVAFIPTASEVEEGRSFSVENRRELLEMGLQPENIVDVNLDHNITFDELKKFDAVYVDGGNTFYLLEKVKESGFDAAVKEYLEKDVGLYVGGSAGTLIMCPDIEIAEPWDDKSKASLTTTKGLGYTTVVWSPHYTEKEKDIVDSYRRRVSYQISELRDGEAVTVVDKNTEVIRG